MGRRLRLLLVEDAPMDARLVVRTIEQAGYEVDWHRVDTREDLEAALDDGPWDAVLSDHSLPTLDALQALAAIQARGVDIPFIVVSGTMTEEIAASTMRAGAHDFIVKGRMARLVPALERELREAVVRHERQLAEQARRAAEARMATVVTSAVDAIITTDGAGRIESANPAAERMFGWREAELLGRDVRELTPQRATGPGDPWTRALQAPVRAPLGASAETEGRHRDGSSFPVDLAVGEMVVGERRTLVGVARDLTERASLEQRLQQLQYHDLVTGVYNRDGFVRMVDALDPVAIPTVSVVVVEIDRLRQVADSFGSASVDRVLVHLADRLRAGVRPDDVLARVDTGAFAIAWVGVAPEEAHTAVSRFRRALREPVELPTSRFYPTGRIAVATGRPGRGTGAALLAEALAALEGAVPGDELPTVTARAQAGTGQSRLLLEADLQEAVRRQGFHLAFQPEIDLRTGRMTSVEALARWTHPVRGDVPPGTFIPIAESMGLIAPLGRWVLEESLRAVGRWRAMPEGSELSVAVNVSAAQLARPEMVDTVLDSLRAADLPGETLCIEVTESAVLSDAARATEALGRLQAAGVRVAIDDFGTGYSSLGQLKHLPVRLLKIDRSFVDGLPMESDDLAIVEAVLALSGAMGLDSVAEGVETPAQLGVLRELGCTTAQGYLLSRPVPPGDIDDLLGRRWFDGG